MIDICTMKSALLVNEIVSGKDMSYNWNIYWPYSWAKYILSDYITQQFVFGLQVSGNSKVFRSYKSPMCPQT